MANSDNVLVPLPGIALPPDLPWRSQFVSLVEDHLQRTSIRTESYEPPRFFGFYFRNTEPVAVAGPWTVLLDAEPPLATLPETIEVMTAGRFAIGAPAAEQPDFILIHDRHDGACWLWRYLFGLRFVMAQDPVLEDDGDWLQDLAA